MENTQQSSTKTHKTLKNIGVILGITLLSISSGVIGATAVLYDNGELSGGGETAKFETVKGDGNKIVSKEDSDLISLVKNVSPSVVSILTSSGSSSYGYAAGTGMIVSKDGYLMTNKHVVGSASRATVITSSGKTYKNVPVLGKDPLNDIAFLKIPNVRDLPAIQLGDSKTVQTGQSVVAIGNALGEYQNSVTTGIISGVGRPVLASEDGTAATAESLTDLFQTDAAINHGNSGGPLLNMKGQVIGINTAIAEDAQSVGFAIPIGAAKGMLKHLKSTGKVERAAIGVQYVSINPEVKAKYKLKIDQGDLIVSDSGSAVRRGSPAAKAGLREGDIMTKVNDHAIGPGKSISTLVGEFSSGDSVEITIVRGGRTLQQSLTLEAFKQ